MVPSSTLPDKSDFGGRVSSPWTERLLLILFLSIFVVLGSNFSDRAKAAFGSLYVLIYPISILLSLVATEAAVRTLDRMTGRR